MTSENGEIHVESDITCQKKQKLGNENGCLNLTGSTFHGVKMGSFLHETWQFRSPTNFLIASLQSQTKKK